MSTRCNIVARDGDSELWFYRHCDGYPESVLPDLEPLMEKLRDGSLRDNLSQFCGWLIVKGHEGYKRHSGFNDWKVGNYEPTTGLHGDVEYVYELDLRLHTLKCLSWGSPAFDKLYEEMKGETDD
jgi:hypothetical protein